MPLCFSLLLELVLLIGGKVDKGHKLVKRREAAGLQL